ncbi:MAG: ATP-binding protein [Armatimonas sp.]
MRNRLFKKRIAQKIYLGVALPLAVLLVAGALVPTFVWVSLQRYQDEYNVRLQQVDATERLRQACVETEAAALNLARYNNDQTFRDDLQGARGDVRNISLVLISLLDASPDDKTHKAMNRVEQSYRVYYRQVNLGNRRANFGSVRARLEELSVTVARREKEFRPEWQRAELARQATAVVVPALAVILSLLLGRAIALGITRPLERLTQAAETLAQGGDPDSLSEEKLPNDELGDLQRTFMEMARSIRQRETVLVTQNEELGDARRRIEAVLDATNDGIALLSRDGMIALVNRRFAYFFGLEPEHLMGQTFEQMRPHILSRFSNRESVREKLRAILKDPDLVSDDTLDLLHPSIRTVRLFTAPVREAEGNELLGRIVVLRDATRETQVDRMKSEFVSTVSHELRTPLTAIQGYVDLILEGKPGPLTATQREFLNMMQSSSQRLTALITDILDISRIEAGKIEIREDDVTYTPLVELIVKMLQGEAQARGVSLTSEIAPGPYPPVRGDTERLQQVLTNLISNGIKYTPSGGSIKVTVRLQDSYVATCVADTGIGIPMEDRERVFEKFYRADNSTTRSAGGTGLGLSISKAIVERLGGSIWVESEPGKGSRFWFTLPVSVPDEPTETLRPAPEPGGKPSQLYLIASGDTGALHRMAHALRPQGIIASAAATPTEAHRRVRGLRPDVLLLDPLSQNFDARAFIAGLRADSSISRQPPVFLYVLRYDIAAAELRDPLVVTPFPANDAMRLGFEATLLAALKDGMQPATGRSPLVVALGDEEFGETLRGLGRQGAHVILTPNTEEAETRLGPLTPSLLVVDARPQGVPLSEVGLLLRRLHNRGREGRLPILLMVDSSDVLLTPDVRPLLPLGASPLPVERLVRTIRESGVSFESNGLS